MSAARLAAYEDAISGLDDWECACPYTCKELQVWKGDYAPNRCVINYLKDGSDGEQNAALGLAWFAAVISLLMFGWYLWQVTGGHIGTIVTRGT